MKKRRRIDLMYGEYGVNEGSFCSNCCNLVADYVSGKKYSGTVCKCIAYGKDKTEETDWRRNYTGCGLYNMPFHDMNKEPLYKKSKNTRGGFYG